MVNHSSMADVRLSTSARRSRPKTGNRQALAFRAGEDALDGSAHGVTLLLYYKHLVALCGPDTSSLMSQPRLAAANGVCIRTIRRYDDYLVAAGLIWLKREGTSYRRFITAYEPEPAPSDEPAPPPPEVQAVEPDPFFAASNADRSIRINRTDRSGSLLFKGSRDLQEEAPWPGGETGSTKGRLAREEQPEAVTVLRAAGVSDPAAREFAHLDADYVRKQLDAAQRCGRARDVPGFLVNALRTGGVFEASSWSSWTRYPHAGFPRAAPQQGASSWSDPPTPDPETHQRQAVLLPTLCPSCGKLCPADVDGHCYRCEPELFPGGGGT